MKLKDFLNYISDEEARIELEIDTGNKDIEYLYTSFWLSDFRNTRCLEYKDWNIDSISFFPILDDKADITIQLNNNYDKRGNKS